MQSMVVPKRCSRRDAAPRAQRGSLHLWAFVLPLITTVFLLTGPHTWWARLLWTLTDLGAGLVDKARAARPPPAADETRRSGRSISGVSRWSRSRSPTTCCSA